MKSLNFEAAAILEYLLDCVTDNDSVQFSAYVQELQAAVAAQFAWTCGHYQGISEV